MFLGYQQKSFPANRSDQTEALKEKNEMVEDQGPIP